jgi:hypothetical protein
MNAQNHLIPYLPKLRLKRLEAAEEAGLWITSLPWPRAEQHRLSLQSQPTHTIPIGQWPSEQSTRPRRLLLIADGGNRAPAEISLMPANKTAAPPAEPIRAEMELFERSPHTEYIWERHLLRIRRGNRSVGLALGLRTGGKVHWWEACRLVVLEESPQCLVVEMGGAIPRDHMSAEELMKYPGLTNPYLHKHNWLNGRLYARLHSNGVCELFAHHINSKFFDDGLPLADVVPVIGLKLDATPDELASVCGPWDGVRDRLALGGVQLDLAEAARLARPEEPGCISLENGFLVLQPYEGLDVYGGTCAEQLLGGPFLFHSKDRHWPRGMARTIRFSLSLSDRSPRVVRYLAPAWWYGVCEEFLPQPLLPVANEYDSSTRAARRWVLDHIVQHGFEDGSVPRHDYFEKDAKGRKRNEPGWEGEIPYAQFLGAWRSGDAEEYSAALRSAYHFTDIAVDHAAKLVRMHGYPPNAIAIPMNRLQGTIAAYLETGDPYLLDTAQAVTAHAYWTHKNSWPRMAVGRDACFARSAMLLYRYFADEGFRRIARDTAMAVVESQRPNGSFGDQGGGTGIHQWGGYITKPWMGLLALNGVLDYLECFPDEPRFADAVRRFADWLMQERFDHDGVRTWSYQHDFDGRRQYFDPFGSRQVIELPGPGRWHQETLGRLLMFCALRFKQPAYFDAWAESHAGCRESYHDHSSAAALQFIPWVQAKLWNATLTEHGIRIRPVHFGPRTPKEGRILTPDGEVVVRWADHDKVVAPKGVEVA